MTTQCGALSPLAFLTKASLKLDSGLPPSVVRRELGFPKLEVFTFLRDEAKINLEAASYATSEKDRQYVCIRMAAVEILIAVIHEVWGMPPDLILRQYVAEATEIVRGWQLH